MAKAKKNYMAEEIGKLRVALSNAQASRDHYFTLVSTRNKQLQQQHKEIRRLHRELAAAKAETESVANTFGR